MSALRDKYSELLGGLKKCDQTAERLRTDLAHIEATIRLFKPDWNAGTVTGTRNVRRAKEAIPFFSTGVGICIMQPQP